MKFVLGVNGDRINGDRINLTFKLKRFWIVVLLSDHMKSTQKRNKNIVESMLLQVLKKNVIENIVPIVVSLKNMVNIAEIEIRR